MFKLLGHHEERDPSVVLASQSNRAKKRLAKAEAGRLNGESSDAAKSNGTQPPASLLRATVRIL
ncbi:hypothetical protein TSOC_001124 [Tetrabaena socialis]|uniref:Uncharacterized protein n=1 Tax=Tetrabaena socialis TaxID=47790 RepID=A0A2J8AHK0_9CHLO|nr:hypothetical protein TSOC_001124 [Tetrabaena socialis]|eukprot:PNH11998.1 hypothetical protein TSOC_001124 [Tetrabaena socialis]